MAAAPLEAAPRVLTTQQMRQAQELCPLCDSYYRSSGTQIILRHPLPSPPCWWTEAWGDMSTVLCVWKVSHGVSQLQAEALCFATADAAGDANDILVVTAEDGACLYHADTSFGRISLGNLTSAQFALPPPAPFLSPDIAAILDNTLNAAILWAKEWLKVASRSKLE